MLKSHNPLPFSDIEISNKANFTLFKSDKIEICPNCGNTKLNFQQYQNGMLFCFICRKASLSEKNFISAF